MEVCVDDMLDKGIKDDLKDRVGTMDRFGSKIAEFKNFQSDSACKA